MQKILYTEGLIISSQGETPRPNSFALWTGSSCRYNKKSVTLPKEKYQSFFKMMFDSGEIVMDTQYPLTEEDTEFRFEFADPNNSAMVLSYASKKLYCGQQEYLELSKIPSQLNSWFKKAGVAG